MVAAHFLPATAPDITLDEILQIRHPDSAAWSPDGAALAWLWDDGGIAHLWMARVDSDAPAQLSRGDRRVSSFAWGRDGGLVYVQGGRLFSVRPDGDEPVELQTGVGAVSEPRFSPDGRRLGFGRAGRLCVMDMPSAAVAEVPMPGRLAVVASDHLSYRWSPDGSHLAVSVYADGQPGLIVMDLTGRVLWRQLGPENITAFIWVDGDRLHFTTLSPLCRSRRHQLLTISTGEQRGLSVEESEKGLKEELAPLLLPGSAAIIYVLTPGNWPHLFECDLATGGLRQLTDGECDDTGHAYDFLSCSPDGRYLTCSSNRDVPLNQRRIWRVDRQTGECAPLTPGPGTDSCAAWSPDGKLIAFMHCGEHESADLWVMNPDGSGAKQISRSMPVSLNREKITVPTHLTYPSHDGMPVHADLFLPKGFDPERRYPAIIWVHGGISRQMRHGWHPLRSYAVFYAFHQYLLHRGFVILSVDYRGSIGYGKEYEQASFMSLGQSDLADVVAGADFLRSQAYVDPEAVAVYGLSYGGYMTLGALTRYPKSFAMGINIAGIIDWLQWSTWRDARYPERQFHGAFGRLGGPPADWNAEAWRQASPRHWVEQLERPLLNLMGSGDESVDFEQLDEIIRLCTKHHKDFAALYYPGESHAFTYRDTWADAFVRMERAFDRYLRCRPEQRPPAML